MPILSQPHGGYKASSASPGMLSGAATLDQRTLEHLRASTFRTSALFELVRSAHLPPRYRQGLRKWLQDPDAHSLLIPRRGLPMSARPVDQCVARLLTSLRQPQPLPIGVRREFRRFHQAIVRLVLDGVLEIEHEGEFVTAASASFLLPDGGVSRTAPPSLSAGLSIAALRYAQALEIRDTAQLSARLYLYNRRPLTPAWARRFPSPAEIARHLGIVPRAAVGRDLHRHWRSVLAYGPQGGWFVWQRPDLRRARADAGLDYKLYISPDPSAMRETFATTVAVLSTAPASCFKTAADAAGLLRPDRLVAYFPSHAMLQHVAQRLRRELDGTPAQGVPFSAGIGADGLLSWGIDPPQMVHQERRRESWRSWLTNQLSGYLLIAKVATQPLIEPWRFAMGRLQLDGVDPTSWTPHASLWREMAAGAH